MGTDIRMIVQRLEDNVWETVPDVPLLVDRCYDHFGILAGIRSDLFPVIQERRGLPWELKSLEIDASAGSLLGEYGFSWLLVSELDAYFQWWPTLRTSSRVNCNGFFELIDQWRALSRFGDGSDVRIVFGFIS